MAAWQEHRHDGDNAATLRRPANDTSSANSRRATLAPIKGLIVLRSDRAHHQPRSGSDLKRAHRPDGTGLGSAAALTRRDHWCADDCPGHDAQFALSAEEVESVAFRRRP
jgi:hypothetical protein